MKKYYITHVINYISTIYLKNDKCIEFDTWKEARTEVIKLEKNNNRGFFAWKKRETEE